MNMVLQTRALYKKFGPLIVTQDVDFDLAYGARHALIGPNGAGKTTLLHQLAGVIAPTQGTIWLEGCDITHLSMSERAKKGLARTFQDNTLFMTLTPLEALLVVICERDQQHYSGWQRLMKPLSTYSREIEEAWELLGRFRLQPMATQLICTLPYGKQRVLEVALAVMMQPKVLLLDEPAAGLSEAESMEMLEMLAALPREISILLIEHDMNLIFHFAEKITVLVAGRILIEGTPADIANHAQSRALYLGCADG